MNGYTGNLEMVDPRLIQFDHRYQRPVKDALVRQIANNPSWEAFGVPVCFKRSNGVLYCADGQQRITAIMQTKEPPRLIPVAWFPLEDIRDEAEVFVYINEWRKGLLPLEKHKAKLKSGDEATLGVARAAEMAGFSIGNAKGGRGADPKTISAVGTLNTIYNQVGEEGLLQTLTLIRDAWPDNGVALGVHVLRGVADLYEEAGDDYNRARMTTMLRKTDPAKVIRVSKQHQFDLGGTRRENVRRAFETTAGIKLPRTKVRKRPPIAA